MKETIFLVITILLVIVFKKWITSIQDKPTDEIAEKYKKGCLTFVLSAFVLACVAMAASIIYFTVPFQGDVEIVAERIGTEPDWNFVYNYIHDSIEPGITRKQVHTVFEQIGEWEIISADIEKTKYWDREKEIYTFYERIAFTERNRYIALGEWRFEYDENDILLEYHKLDLH